MLIRSSTLTSRLLKLILLIGLIILPATEVTAQKKKRGGGPSLIKTDVVKRMPRVTVQSFVGTLQPVRRAVIGSAVEERVANVLVREGDFVQVSDDTQNSKTLVELSHDTIDLQREAAEIELQLRRKTLEELQITIPKQIEAAKAQVGRIEAELKYARNTYQRLQRLGSNGMSRKEIEESLSQVQSAEQALLAAQAEFQRLTSTKSVRTAIAEKNIAAQESELNRIKDAQKKHTVFAPFTGYITKRMVEQGNWVTRGTPLIELVQLDPIELRVLVPQEHAVSLQRSFDSSGSEDYTAEIEIDSMSEPLQGKVTRIIPDADPRTRSIPVIIEIENPKSEKGGHLLKPGLLARAKLAIGQQQQVLMVPKDALVLNQGTASLYVVERNSDKSVARQVKVTTGQTNGNWIEVNGELEESAEIVVQGNERLRTGTEVRVIQ